MTVRPLVFDRDFDPRHGEAVTLTPLVRRVVCNNPGPFTFHGTNTFLVGRKELAVIDPGPDDPVHVAAISRAAGSTPITAILATHTHRDHSPAATALQAATGARIYGEGRHRTARPLALGEINPLDASGDHEFLPDIVLGHGDIVRGDGWTLEAVATPGHTVNHLCFALREEGSLFTGDHVMAWSTSIVAPPDGLMRDYMASLQLLLERSERHYHPAHGASITDGHEFVRGLVRHREARSEAALAALSKGPATIAEMVETIYSDTPKSLHGAAALSLFAQVEDLVERGLVACEGVPSLVSVYRRV